MNVASHFRIHIYLSAIISENIKCYARGNDQPTSILWLIDNALHIYDRVPETLFSSKETYKQVHMIFERVKFSQNFIGMPLHRNTNSRVFVLSRCARACVCAYAFEYVTCQNSIILTLKDCIDTLTKPS